MAFTTVVSFEFRVFVRCYKWKANKRFFFLFYLICFEFLWEDKGEMAIKRKYIAEMME